MTSSVLETVQTIIQECNTPGVWRHDLPADMFTALRMAEGRIRMLEKYLDYGPEQRAHMASRLMPPVNGLTHPTDIIKYANVAVRAADALIEALQA